MDAATVAATATGMAQHADTMMSTLANASDEIGSVVDVIAAIAPRPTSWR
ncbi:MAG: hypothetical protein R2705_06220 [Ilumatobacteraceae bacterium]